MNRNEFIRRSALAAVGTWLIPDFVKAYERDQINTFRTNDKVLVIVQFSGGNDGLNTLIPFRNDIYYRERPKLAIPETKVLKLTDELALHPALEKLRSWYDQGYFRFLNNVGYPNPDRSHFRSMDIWHTASDASEYRQTGWIGRYLDAQCSGTCQPYQALEIDDQLSLSMKGERVKGLAVSDPKRLYQQTKNPFYQELARANHEAYANVDYLYKTLAETLSSSAYIHAKTDVTGTTGSYPTHELGRRLKTVADFIRSGVDSNVYYVSHGSFDTHVNQQPKQEQLLRQYAEALDVFMQDLKAQHKLDEVLVLTFSEFGRRVKQNASNGTDHGTANCVFLAGGNLALDRQYQAVPDLSDLDQGDLKYKVDFRNLYATLLDHWLGIDSTAVLGKPFPGLKLA
ncbi:twin-arginine translocation pathway signal [Siphonobacter sp. BAB-5385]|uniref:DUF1501 domain-containing protein n=1 Tax=Siphonobacter sp. BAB-5385 TaxID=1864822 RepID=UPI000B9E4514|nr:DUF1501 domain-containing protein [Siphonobacter sp. BAB-5385]OZI10018.1 twin-arginine translocation pathway signal [Siphonobacter sp. BAB-5385]